MTKRIITGAVASLAMAFSFGTASAAETAPSQIPYQVAADLFDDNVQFIDVRPTHISEAGQIEGAASLPLRTEFTREALAMLASVEHPIVFYCNDGIVSYSKEAAKLAKEWGYKNVYVIDGGFPHWNQASLPIE